MEATMIGLDIAKSIFHVHVVDGSGRTILSRKLRRAQVEPFFARHPKAVVGLEACGSAHHWARIIAALGHEVRLIPAAYVKPYVKRNKTDARDAEAICEALSRPNMRFVPVKTVTQQASRGLERSLDLLTRQRSQLMNSLRSLLAEIGIIARIGERGFAELRQALNDAAAEIPELLRESLQLMARHIDALSTSITVLQAWIEAVVRNNAVMRRLMTIPGIGPLTAHAVVTAIGDGRQFRCARDFAAWCGLTRREHASAGKSRGGRISRQGETRLRTLFALGASTIMRHVRRRGDRATVWQRGILARRPVKVAVLAQAAKTARIAWAVLTSGETYRRPAAA
jgi:transposase